MGCFIHSIAEHGGASSWGLCHLQIQAPGTILSMLPSFHALSMNYRSQNI